MCPPAYMVPKYPSLNRVKAMFGRHFHTSMKVQIARCKDNNNSKNRAATFVKFYIYIYIMISVHYIQYIKYSIFNVRVEFQDIKFHQS